MKLNSLCLAYPPSVSLCLLRHLTHEANFPKDFFILIFIRREQSVWVNKSKVILIPDWPAKVPRPSTKRGSACWVSFFGSLGLWHSWAVSEREVKYFWLFRQWRRFLWGQRWRKQRYLHDRSIQTTSWILGGHKAWRQEGSMFGELKQKTSRLFSERTSKGSTPENARLARDL